MAALIITEIGVGKLHKQWKFRNHEGIDMLLHTKNTVITKSSSGIGYQLPRSH